MEQSRQPNRHAGHVPVLEPARHRAAYLLRQHHKVEVVKVVAAHGAPEQLPPVQVRPRALAHAQDPLALHAVDKALADVRARRLSREGLRGDVPLGEVARGAAQAVVAGRVVGRAEGRGQPERLGVGHGAEVPRPGTDDLGFLARDGADGEAAPVLLGGEDLVAVEAVEGGRGVLAGDLAEDGLAAWVGGEEVGEVVDDAVDDAPEGGVGGVAAHLVAREAPRWRCHGGCWGVVGEFLSV